MNMVFTYLKNKFKKSSGRAMISNLNFKEAYGGTLPLKNESMIRRYASHLQKLDDKLD